MARAHAAERPPDFGTMEAHVHQAHRRPIAAFGYRAIPALGDGSALATLARIPMPALADLALDVLLAEGPLCMEGVVSTTAHAQVSDLVGAAACSRDDVIELEPGRRGAAMPLCL